MSLTPADAWSGPFGDAYTDRNRFDYKARIPFWRHVLEVTQQPREVLEVGCNCGNNLLALQAIVPTINARGVDLNEHALCEATLAGANVMQANAIEVGLLWPAKFQLVATVGCLIHVPPETLTAAMLSIRRASKRWVVAVEYFAVEEIEVKYRGEVGLLWKRPFGKLYQELGMNVIEEGDAGEGFDRCKYVICER